MGARAIRVLVCYQHSLLGLGLTQLLGRQGWIQPIAVDASDTTALEAALAQDIDAVVLEEGGSVEAIELFRRSQCTLLVDVDMGSGDCWTIHRGTLRTTPDQLLQLLADARRPIQALPPAPPVAPAAARA